MKSPKRKGERLSKSANIDKLIPEFYRIKTWHTIIYAGAKMYLEASIVNGKNITAKEAIEKTLELFNINEDELPLRTAENIYSFTEKLFYSAQKSINH